MSKMQQIAVRLPVGLIAVLKKAATKDKRPLAAYIRKVLEETHE